MYSKFCQITIARFVFGFIFFISLFGVIPASATKARASLQVTPALLNPSRLSFQEVASGLSNPVLITHAGDGSGRIFLLERTGRIRIIKNGKLLTTPFLDIQPIVKSTGGEQGLLALVFHPSYENNGKFYVVYTAARPGDTDGSILTLRQYTVSAGDPDVANSNSAMNILTIDHPTYPNHNGGTIAFANDGYLYWSTGDGGGGGDPNNNAQNLTSLLGKILRIDVNSGSPYSIPAGNPFSSSPDSAIKKEIWSYGFRNPWRISFDRTTHDLYAGDVGQSSREEIDFQPANSPGGENYGWRVMEGSLCYNPSSGCDPNGKILPVAEYDHTLGCSVTGGYVYRGSTFPSLYGYYFYGDYCSGRLFSLYKDPGLGWKSVELLNTPYTISTFGEDQQGELYLADYSTGKIYNIGYQESTPPSGNSGPGDFDGDRKTDPAKFYPGTGTVWWFQSSTGTWDGRYLGSDTFTYVPGSDFDGDGKTDPAKFYPGTGTVWWLKSSTGSWDGRYLGSDTFTYVPGADFDGDGKTDPAKFYPGTGTVWWLKSSTGAWDGRYLGWDTFTYVSGSDFDGDGKTDPAKFYPGTGTVWWLKSSTGAWDGRFLGADAYIYVPGSDFDGDGKTDPAKFYPGTGVIWWLKSSSGTWDGRFLGADAYIYVPGSDFDGDGKTDPAKFYPGTGVIWWLKSSTETWDGRFLGADSYLLIH